MQFVVVKLDRNRRQIIGECYVRANSTEQAERIGRAILGRGPVVASEYRPERDSAFAGYVRQSKWGEL